MASKQARGTSRKRAVFTVFLYVMLTFLVILVVGALALTLPSLASTTLKPEDEGPLAPGQPQPGRRGTPGSQQPGQAPTPPTPAWIAPTPISESPITNTSQDLTPLGQNGAWNLVFQDEFDSPALDPRKWTTCYPWFDAAGGCTNAGNNEIQWYLPQSVTVADGTLALRVAQAPHTGSDGTIYPYTSGMISSGGDPGSPAPRFAYQYGYAEAQMKIPAGRGIWPAFWLAPADGSWPPEVDIAERVGGSSPNKIGMIVHYPLPEGEHGSDISEFAGPDFQAEWHVFALDWTPDRLVWYVDGMEVKRYQQVDRIPQTPMYIVFTLAVLGKKAPDASVQFPLDFQVGYVRVWQHR